ncbi:hypothetical protein O181_033106 [Austropuccinia psidii MF-1]|uniref:Uncharacterized protein n=1 Tax=Austropuccinia psidii MF-1 TaxID=1389203 RepID=A0A9Q3H6S3_9BASI|nr:hypothetical protein [Austropuccinia psidii MF-1]
MASNPRGGFPSRSGKPPTSTQIELIIQEPRMVHIWYYKPFCTIFPQKSKGDVFRTKLGHSNSSPQNPSLISKEDFSSIQSCNPWQLPEDHLRTPITWPFRSWVVISFRILLREISRGYQEFNQLSRHQVLQYSLYNSIGPYRLYSSKLYGIVPFGSIHIPLWEFHHTVQISRWPDLY